jgi:hypothetical protein
VAGRYYCAIDVVTGAALAVSVRALELQRRMQGELVAVAMARL